MVTKSKIVLVRPLCDLGFRGTPLGLLYVGTLPALEGYNVKIIDVAKEPNYKSVITREVKNALLVGITCVTTEVKSAIEISDLIKATCNVPVIWGGWHPTLFPTQTCSDKSVDFVCVNEGDYTLLEVAKSLESGNSFEKIDGLVYKKQGQVKANPRNRFVDLDKLPSANYGLLDVEKYVDTKIQGERQISYQSSRGCPHRCSFCINPATGNRVWRMKSAGKMVDEIESLVAKYRINSVDIVDDNFFVNLGRVEDFCKELISKKLSIKWYAECRADYFDRLKPKLDLCQKSGLSRLFIGAESGAQRILNLLNKDITVEQIVDSARILSKYDIEPTYSFIIGTPRERNDEVKMTVKLAAKVKGICRKAKYHFSLFTPYPRCEISKELLAEGLIYEPKTLREWKEDEARKLYARREFGKPWQKDPRFLENLAYYAALAYANCSDQEIADNIKKLRIQRWANIFFLHMARIRMKVNLMGVPIDKYIRQVSRVFQS